jgi:hypothetical protein
METRTGTRTEKGIRTGMRTGMRLWESHCNYGRKEIVSNFLFIILFNVFCLDVSGNREFGDRIKREMRQVGDAEAYKHTEVRQNSQEQT